jgi:hypothetical protein
MIEECTCSNGQKIKNGCNFCCRWSKSKVSESNLSTTNKKDVQKVTLFYLHFDSISKILELSILKLFLLKKII